MIAFLIWLALLQSPDPGFTAYWRTSISAVISWQSTERACLYRNSIFINCYDKPGEYHILLGGPLTDGMLRPTAHDVYRLLINGQTYSAPLQARILLPII